MANAYQLFNPLTGAHTRYETEAEAKTAFAELAKQVLTVHSPGMVEEITHENGDVTWVPVDFVSQLVVTI
jgi:hypothetical protein